MADILVLVMATVMVALLANGLYAAGFEKGKQNAVPKDVYLHIAYSNGFDPLTGEAKDFSVTDPDRTHIGIQNSQDPHPSLVHSAYLWTRIKEEKTVPLALREIIELQRRIEKLEEK